MDSAANRHFVVIVNECYWPQIMQPVLHLRKHVRQAPAVYDPGAQIKAIPRSWLNKFTQCSDGPQEIVERHTSQENHVFSI